MSIRLEEKMKALEAKALELEEMLITLVGVVDKIANPTSEKLPDRAISAHRGPSSLCPYCQEKPAHHLHVVNCPKRKKA